MSDNHIRQQQIQAELAQAEIARTNQNEGKARVCARRAAGSAIGAYLQHKGLPVPGPSAIDRLNFLAGLPDIPVEWRQMSNRLLIRVNQDFELPIEADLIADARKLAAELFAAIDENTGIEDK